MSWWVRYAARRSIWFSSIIFSVSVHNFIIMSVPRWHLELTHCLVENRNTETFILWVINFKHTSNLVAGSFCLVFCFVVVVKLLHNTHLFYLASYYWKIFFIIHFFYPWHPALINIVTSPLYQDSVDIWCRDDSVWLNCEQTWHWKVS